MSLGKEFMRLPQMEYPHIAAKDCLSGFAGKMTYCLRPANELNCIGVRTRGEKQTGGNFTIWTFCFTHWNISTERARHKAC